MLWLAALVVAGRITIDLQIGEGIPISGQTIVVLLTGYYLGYKEIALLYVSYLVGGALCNLPFFADGSHGLDVVLGKSGGYLYSFPLAAAYMQYQRQRGASSPYIWLLHAVISTALILLVGMLHLSAQIGLEKAWLYGVLPFLAGGLIKAVLVVLVTVAVSKYTTRLAD